MFIKILIYSPWYLKDRGVYTGTIYSDVNMEIRDLHQFKNKDMVNSIKLDSSLFYLMGSK